MSDPRVNKLRYRAWRRGILEADLILGPFADACLDDLDAAALDEFDILLQQPDPDLYAWIIGQAETPADFDNATMNQIKAFRISAHATREAMSARER